MGNGRNLMRTEVLEGSFEWGKICLAHLTYTVHLVGCKYTINNHYFIKRLWNSLFKILLAVSLNLREHNAQSSFSGGVIRSKILV